MRCWFPLIYCVWMILSAGILPAYPFLRIVSGRLRLLGLVAKVNEPDAASNIEAVGSRTAATIECRPFATITNWTIRVIRASTGSRSKRTARLRLQERVAARAEPVDAERGSGRAGAAQSVPERVGGNGVVERLVGIEPDPAHPTGKALCAKGRASPALVEAPDRLIYPIRPPVRRVTLIGAGDTSPGELQPIRIGRNGFS